ncbi:hypothetical protein K443DRAFT_100028 [Laccaria amethystina LaAM-08-1]|uniref:HNH nuclease domain-containing protein n=1 Tax=Laccaria amethystina LaAM-08-1 TaxID=1095629 RepID=A0A0C9X6F0_9AGAR|nr:hypothetical protein K443DRAFT_100028 [Laccaria amethystina LaAM-08-1]
MLDLVNAGGLGGTSLENTRSVKEFLDLLKEIIMPADFHLQTLQNCQDVDTEGIIGPGEYLIVGEAQEYGFTPIRTLKQAAALLRGTAFGKKRKLSTTESSEGGRSQCDNSEESAGFKSRLIARDKGCVVCMAQNQDDDSIYLYEVDSEMFIGAHIFPLQYYDLWDRKRYSQIVADPYSAAGASTSRNNRQNTDTRRMNSVDNGLLLCVKHHIQFDAHLFSIHPETHIVTSFHPRTRYINGLTITQPWLNRNAQYPPPPHSTLLRDHFMSSIATWMSATPEEYEEEDSFEDEDEIPETTGTTNDSCLFASELGDDVVLP